MSMPRFRDRKAVPFPWGHSPGAPKGHGNGNYRDGTFAVKAVEEKAVAEIDGSYVQRHRKGHTFDWRSGDTAALLRSSFGFHVKANG